MPTITGSNVFFWNTFDQLSRAVLGNHSDTQFAISDGWNAATVTGSGFTYAGGAPSGGTITSITVTPSDSRYGPGTFSGISVPVATFWATVRSGNWTSLYTLIWGGNDTFTGTSGDDTFDISQGGDDIVNCNGGSDVIKLGSTLTVSDRIVGAGYNPSTGGINAVTVVLDGDYSAGLALSATTLVNVTGIQLTGGYSYKITTNDAMMTHVYQYYADTGVDGSSLGTADTLYYDGSAETDAVQGITGGAGNDTLIGGAAADGIRGGSGNDTIYGGGGGDSIDAGSGVNVVHGGDGADTMVANTGLSGSQIFGDAGNDYVSGGTPNGSTFDGGGGKDYWRYYGDQSFNPRNLTINLAAGTITDGTSTDTIANFEGVSGGYGDDTITGSAGDDWLVGGGGHDLLEGGIGDDTLIGERLESTPFTNSFIFYGGSWAGLPEIDTVSFAHAARGETIDPCADERHPALPAGVAFGGDGLDTIYLCQNFILSSYNDVFMGSPVWNYNYKVWGGDGNDTIIINHGFTAGHEVDTGVNVLYGGNGDDVLSGGYTDLSMGSINKDVLNGGAGADIMTGNTGNDTFEFASSSDLSLDADHITDFTPGDDMLDFGAIAGLSFIGTAAFGGVAGQLRYDFQNGQTVLQLDADGDRLADGLLVLDNGCFNIVATVTDPKKLVGDDGAAPVLVSLSPDNGAAKGASPLSLTFNETVRAGSGTISLYDSASGLIGQIGIATSYVSFVGNSVTISGAFGLERGHSYYITVSDGAIVDSAGHAFAGLTTPISWAFNLAASVTGPISQGLSVSTGGGGVPLNPTITLTFDKDIVPVSGTIMISNAQANEPFITILATDTSQVTVSGNTLIIKPTTALFGSTTYLITTPNLTVADASGNQSGVNYDYVSNTTFTTIVRQDTTAPTLISATPSTGSPVSPGTSIVLTFSEEVRPGYTWAITGLSYDDCFWITRASDGHLIKSIAATDTTQVTFSGNTVVINPNIDLPGNMDFIVSYGPYAVQDLAGNFAGGHDISAAGPQTFWFRATTFSTTSEITGTRSNDVLPGTGSADMIYGLAGNDTLSGGDEHDTLTGGAGNDALDGGSNIDTAVFAGNFAAYTVTQGAAGVFTVSGTDGTDTLSNVEFAQFGDQTVRLLPGTGAIIDWSADPSTYMAGIRDFDGNDLGAASGWKLIGTADVNGDGTVEHILVNRQNGRWAEISTEADGKSYLNNFGWAGDSRVVGIYIDPLVASGEVVAGGDFDSQRRFQNDLNIENIHGVLGQNDYNHDGLQEIYFSLTDGTAYLHAYMHADGNIQYANYQNEQQVKDYLTANGFTSAAWAGWFPVAQNALAAVVG